MSERIAIAKSYEKALFAGRMEQVGSYFTDDVVYWGTGPIVGGLSWTGSACGLGTSGTGSFDPGDPAPGAFFYFVVVGQNASGEGSYGQAFDGVTATERPQGVGVGACPMPQDLTGSCP